MVRIFSRLDQSTNVNKAGVTSERQQTVLNRLLLLFLFPHECQASMSIDGQLKE